VLSRAVQLVKAVIQEVQEMSVQEEQEETMSMERTAMGYQLPKLIILQ
jgi:hypothetical protein